MAGENAAANTEAPPEAPPEAPSEAQTPLAKRQQIMDQIQSARDGDLGIEPEPAAEPTPEPTPEPPAEPTPAPVEATPPAETPPPEPTVITDPDALVTVKIDGQERQVKLSEVTRNYQLDEAASQRFTQANEMLRGLQDLQSRTAQEPAAPAPEGAEAAPSEPVPPEGGAQDPWDIADWAGIAQSLQFSEPEKAGEDLKEFMGNLRTQNAGAPAPEPGATYEEMREQFALDQEWNEAITKFGDQFSDIAKDSVLGPIAGAKARAYLDEAVMNSEKSGAEFPGFYPMLERAGKELQTWVAGIRGENPPPSADSKEPIVQASKTAGDPPAPTGVSDKTAIKRAASTAPVPGAAAEAVELPPDTRSEAAKRSSIIEDMRAHRTGAIQ